MAKRIRSLKALAAAEADCRRCPLYRHATHAVPGQGPGRVLDRAIADAGLDRSKLFVTNAVKHFKFEPRGKRRLHKRPNAYEIDRCRHWLDAERAIVKPRIIVAMGATAIRGVHGKRLTIAKWRGRLILLPDGAQMIATVHPSYLLRIPDAADKRRQYRLFVRDLKFCKAEA
jgi:DNA polymerase